MARTGNTKKIALIAVIVLFPGKEVALRTRGQGVKERGPELSVFVNEDRSDEDNAVIVFLKQLLLGTFTYPFPIITYDHILTF